MQFVDSQLRRAQLLNQSPRFWIGHGRDVEDRRAGRAPRRRRTGLSPFEEVGARDPGRGPLKRSANFRAAVLVALLAACGEQSDPRLEESATRALDYLSVTGDELGIDVVVALRIYAEAAGDDRAEAIARARQGTFSEEVQRVFAIPLGGGHAAYRDATLEGVAPPSEVPDPLQSLDDDREQTCPLEALTCELSAPCLEYATMDDRWGYSLTHQALVYVFARWAECDLPLEVDAERETIAARLVAEMRFDPAAGDLAYERMAMLGHLGYAAEIQPEWLDALYRAQDPTGCFPVDALSTCHPHPTGLALWALSHVR